MSLSLHSSTEYLVGSNRWSLNDRDIDPEKSSIGEISSKISSSPEVVLTSSRPALTASATRACQTSLPISQSKLETWRSSRLGTSSGSRIFAKESRVEGRGTAVGAALEDLLAAKRWSFRGRPGIS